jgi:ElaB/YqjD/DUF883 family membrane-anchored ribosome-binding protein
MKNGRDARDRLEEDFRRVVRDAEALLRATADQGSDAVAAVRERAEETLREARSRLYQLEGDLVHRTRAAAKATDELVHDRPWQAIGIAAGVGFLIGVLSGRR